MLWPDEKAELQNVAGVHRDIFVRKLEMPPNCPKIYTSESVRHLHRPMLFDVSAMKVFLPCQAPPVYVFLTNTAVFYYFYSVGDYFPSLSEYFSFNILFV